MYIRVSCIYHICLHRFLLMIKYDEWLSMMYVQICVQHQICGLGNNWSEFYARALPANWRPHLGQPRPCSYKESKLLDSSSKHVPRMLIESPTFMSGCWVSFPNNQFASICLSPPFILANRDCKVAYKRTPPSSPDSQLIQADWMAWFNVCVLSLIHNLKFS